MNPHPQGNHLSDIVAVDSNVIIAVGKKGTILRSTSSGEIWTLTVLPGAPEIADISFPGTEAGWVAAVKDSVITLYKTTDEGESWSAQSNFQGTSSRFHAFDADTCWISTDDTLFRSDDGGESWGAIGGFPEINDVWFLTPSLGWVISNHDVYRTTDGGNGWTTIPLAPLFGLYGVQLMQIRFVNASDGWLHCAHYLPNEYTGSVARTTDGGLTWSTQITVGQAFGPYQRFSDIEPLDSLLCRAVANDGTVYRTTDGGANWDTLASVPYLWFMTSSDGSIFYGTGINGALFRSTDGGHVWTTLSRGSYINVSDLSVVDGDFLIAAGDESLLKSSDGGAHWSETAVDLPDDYFEINTVSFRDSLEGWIGCSLIGGWGGLYRTTDGGANWSPRYINISSVRKIFFLDENRGWFAAGKSVYNTVNGGAIWIGTEVLGGGELYDVFFTGPDSGWAGGWTGLFRTTDGGWTWDSVPLPSGWNIVASIFFLNADSGWVVTEQPCQIFRTTDGGSSWEEQSVPVSTWDYPRSAVFLPSGEGWIAGWQWGQAVTMIHTTDAGTNWTVVDHPAGKSLNRLKLDPGGYLWVTGDGGTIMRARAGAPDTVDEVPVNDRWNIVSVPFAAADFSKTALFPTATSEATTWENGYVTTDTLEPGRGYWMKFSSPESVHMEGGYLDAVTVEVDAGWNLVGSLSEPLITTMVGSVPAGMVTSAFYRYDGNYVRSTVLEPGSGYWVKTDRPGVLVLSSYGATPAVSRIRIEDRGESPPEPPSTGASPGPGIALEFRLSQNRPNPFNPSTVIAYVIPSRVRVSLKIHDLLGRTIATLADGIQEPGAYSLEWNAAGVPSGVYFFTMRAGNFTETRKMVLMR